LTINQIDKPSNTVKCTVNNNAVLGETKNVHLPGAKITLPALSEKDKSDLLFGVTKGLCHYFKHINSLKELTVLLHLSSDPQMM
jgi:pyruvate kinase